MLVADTFKGLSSITQLWALDTISIDRDNYYYFICVINTFHVRYKDIVIINKRCDLCIQGVDE